MKRLLPAATLVLAHGAALAQQVMSPPFQTSVLDPRPALSAGVTCNGGDDTAALNALLVSGAWSLPASTTCLVSSELNLAGSASLSGHQWSSVISPNTTVTSLIDIAGASNNRATIDGIYLFNVSSQATNGVHYHTASSNNPISVKNSRFFGLPVGVLADGTGNTADAFNIDRNYFQSVVIAVNSANGGLNSSAHGNYVFNGSGFNFTKAVGGQQNEGTRVYDNSVLPNSAAGAYAMSISAGLELSVFANVFDQIKHNHCIILDASTNPVSAIKFISNWCGLGSLADANLDGFNVTGAPNYIPLIANTIRNFNRYGVNFTGGGQDVPLIANWLAGNTSGDANFVDVVGVQLIANRFQSNPAWVESGITTTVAIGNRCDHPATVNEASLVLGDGSCAPNRIPGPLTVREKTDATTEQMILANTSTTNTNLKSSGIAFTTRNQSVTDKGTGRIRAIPNNGDVTSAELQFYVRKSDTLSNTVPDLKIDTVGNVEVGSALMVGSLTPLTLTSGALGLAKMTASGSAPGAAGGKLELVCGTTAGTAKLIAYAGTSTTPVVIFDDIGGGVTGC